jgi:serine/threonine protein kinase
MHTEKSISDVLAEISELQITDITSYLRKEYDFSPAKIQTILQIIEIDNVKTTPEFSEVVSNVASLVISDFTPEFYINKTFGDFISKRLIYSHNKSMVFIGSPRSKSYEHDVAIKVISPTHLHIAGQEHLAMQAQYMANIQDANIVEINSAGTTDEGIQYLVMEYLPGMNIKDHCIKNELSTAARLSLFLKVCSGVYKMHSKMIIHSDIKHSNILMDVNQNPKIIDFDFSQSNSSSLHENFNYKNVNGYTSTYAAPEQLLDVPEVTISTDVFGLGGLLFEILTGTPYSKKKLPTESCIREALGKTKRIEELAFIIDMAVSVKPSNRHAGVNELMNDIQDVLDGDRISTSYKNKAKIGYKLKHYFSRNRITVATIFSICILIIISVSEIIEERDNAKQSLKLVMKSNDPRELKNNVLLEKFANDSYNKTHIDKQDYYDELMGWGETYYGKGMSEKATKYFAKAQMLYADPFSNQRIKATSRLLQTYYSRGLVHRYKEVAKPYLVAVQQDNISNPYLIELILIMAEIDSRYNQTVHFGKMKKTPSELLSNINLAEVKEKDLREKLRINLLIGKGIELYYSIPDDHVSTRSYISLDTYENSVKPALLQSKALFEEALALIRSEEIRTHLEPTIYLWIAYLYAELGDSTASETYRTISLNKALSIFDEYHPRVTNTYLKSFAMHRYSRPEKAVEYARLAHESYKHRLVKDHDLQIMTWTYLIIAHFNNGDYKSGIKEMNDFRNTYKSFDSSTTFIASFISTTGLQVMIYAYLNTPEIEDVLNLTVDLEFILRDLGYLEVDLDWVNVVKARSSGTPDSHMNAIKKYAEYVENDAGFDADTKVTEYLFLLTGCYTIEDCPYEKYVRKVEQHMQWSLVDDRESIEKLTVISQLSFYYLNLGELSKAEAYLAEIEPIINKQTFQNSFHISYFYKLKSQLAYARNEIATGQKYKEMALKGALYNFGEDSKFVAELKSLN